MNGNPTRKNTHRLFEALSAGPVCGHCGVNTDLHTQVETGKVVMGMHVIDVTCPNGLTRAIKKCSK